MFLNVFPNSAPDNDIPAYIPSASGGEMPPITPQMQGNIAATIIGLAPVAANKLINAEPKMTTTDEPGIIIVIKQVSKGISSAKPKRFMLSDDINVSISADTFKSENNAPIIYPKTQAPTVGEMLFTPFANIFAMAFGVTDFLSLTTIIA